MPELYSSSTLSHLNVLERLCGEKTDDVQGLLADADKLAPPKYTQWIRPGSVYHGIQSSQSNKYRVKVQLQDVNLTDAFLCGYLTIEGLTDEFPTLTTFFEAEIISKRYPFQTRKWDATLDTDIEHWTMFPFWREKYAKYMHDPQVHANPITDPYIFMRWKEHFLVPNHRITQVAGASYAGFYYVCLDVQNSVIDGYYFHSNSEKFQRLSLTCERHDTFPSFEFR